MSLIRKNIATSRGSRNKQKQKLVLIINIGRISEVTALSPCCISVTPTPSGSITEARNSPVCNKPVNTNRRSAPCPYCLMLTLLPARQDSLSVDGTRTNCVRAIPFPRLPRCQRQRLSYMPNGMLRNTPRPYTLPPALLVKPTTFRSLMVRLFRNPNWQQHIPVRAVNRLRVGPSSMKTAPRPCSRATC